MGVGNRQKGDDGAGPAVVDRLAGKIPVPCIDAGVSPENFLERIAREKPETVVFLDAADLGEAPGSIRVLGTAALSGGLSTHALSLDMAAQYLEARCGAKTALIAIQPAGVDLDAPLSDAVAASVTELADALIELCSPR